MLYTSCQSSFFLFKETLTLTVLSLSGQKVGDELRDLGLVSYGLQ